MPEKKLIVLTHGGAGARNEYIDGTDAAAQKGLLSLQSGASVLESVCSAVTVLEDDTRFNAGSGSCRRSDGSVQMDSACMDSSRQFGAAAVVSGFKNPVKIAYAVSKTPQRLLAGTGAETFARAQGCEIIDPDKIRKTPLAKATDTVGCVAFDGEQFAAALSTGGTGGSPPGRVGDVPLIGCGLYAGPEGAVAATGFGEAIAMNVTALRVYRLLERGASPSAVLREAISWFSEDFGLILVSRKGYAGGSNRTMPWSVREIEQNKKTI
jgi:isoaspartyl peptidase/L-asparaginase-like protein (Ntn-hydrolase superfamily)